MVGANLLLILVLALSFIVSVSRSFFIYSFLPSKGLMELSVIVMLCFIFLAINKTRISAPTNIKHLLMILVGLFFVGFIPHLVDVNVKSMLLALVQFILTFKFWVVLLLTLFIIRAFKQSSYEIFKKHFLKFCFLLLLLYIFSCLLQLSSVSVHKAIFSNTPAGAYFPKSMFLYTGVPLIGCFFHPGLAALFCVSIGLAFYSLDYNRGVIVISRISLCVVLFVLTLQRAEILMFVISVLIASAPVRKLKRRLHYAGCFVLVAYVFTSFGFTDVILSGVANNYQSIYEVTKIPRFAMFLGGFSLANDFFPVGGGLATFGGSQATVNPNNLFYVSGITELWWFAEGKFLTDSYWPMIIGEFGYIGVALIVGLLLCTVRLFSEYRTKLTKISVVVLIVCFLALNSIFSPTLSGDIFPLLLLSIIMVVLLEEKRRKNEVF